MFSWHAKYMYAIPPPARAHPLVPTRPGDFFTRHAWSFASRRVCWYKAIFSNFLLVFRVVGNVEALNIHT